MLMAVLGVWISPEVTLRVTLLMSDTMNEPKLSIWIFALANMEALLQECSCVLVTENIFSRTTHRRDAVPPITDLYFGHRMLIFAWIALPCPWRRWS